MSLVMKAKALVKGGARPVVRALAKAAYRIPRRHWNLALSANGTLQYAAWSVPELLKTFGSPLHIIDDERLRANVAELSGPSASGRKLDIFFSYKTQPVPAVLRRLHDLGVGAEVISEFELDLALHLGVPADRIIYNGPGKSEKSIRTAIERDILLLNVNHLEEIESIAAIARSLKRKARVGIRVGTSGGWAMQFGLPIASGEAFEAFRRALALPELAVVGLHSHRGGKIRDAETLQAFVWEVLQFADVLKSKLGYSPEILDLGGSLGVPTVRPYTPRDVRLGQTFHVDVGGEDPARSLSRADYARLVLEQVESHFQAAERPVPRLMIEPGRALTGDAQALACSVMTVRAVPDAPAFAILDAGINLASILRSEYHEVFHASKPEVPRDHRYRLAGPICQPGDVIYQCISLPAMEAGDPLLIMDSGAYFEPDSTAFSFGRPASVMIADGAVRLVRERETFDRLIARDRF